MTQYLGHLRCHLRYSNPHVLQCKPAVLRSSFLESAPTYRAMQEVSYCLGVCSSFSWASKACCFFSCNFASAAN